MIGCGSNLGPQGDEVRWKLQSHHQALPAFPRIRLTLKAAVDFRFGSMRTFRTAIAMSALGQKRTYAVQTGMSALPPIATAKAKFHKRPCPLCPQKRTCAAQLGMSALGQKRTSAPFASTGSSGRMLSLARLGARHETSPPRILASGSGCCRPAGRLGRKPIRRDRCG
jgi:hypothetical protein